MSGRPTDDGTARDEGGAPARPPDGGEPLGAGIAVLIALASAAAALSAGHLIAGLLDPGSSPFLAVGDTAIDLTPAPVKDFAIAVFGTADKIALLVGMALVIGLLAVAAGLLSRRGPGIGTAAVALFGLLGAAAVLARPDLGPLSLVAPSASLAAGVLSFRLLHSAASSAAEADVRAVPGEPSAGPDRRTVLLSTGAVVLGAGAAGLGGQALAGGVDPEAQRAAIGDLVPDTPAPPLPAGADFAKVGTPTFLTRNEDFYRIDTALRVPRLRVEDWSLRIHGMVDRELTLTFDDLRNRPLVEKTITLVCVSNEVGGDLISTANFIGVPLRDVLAEAGVRSGAEQLFSTSSDGWTAGTPIDVLLEADRNALLAIGMNGEPLPAEHGFPVRMVVPGLYGFVSATKWIVDAEVTTFGRPAYWEQRGWAREAPIKTQSRIDRPRPFDEVRAGRMTAAGIAWAQHTGIDRVEVRLDGGAWRQAQLSTEVNDQTWRMWRIELDVPSGGRRLECRATDRDGITQPEERVAPVPDGATGRHSVLFTATD
ncbi:DMSO/TMAO reductase YedYZ molybdopterin-dependent catalytic subunit [Actinoalloteichus hoggarensis]|uniref:Sulfoxide reductase catalytic subunit YedY n=1 Tax=Actinoalloteichus hoggarensis TaxID=1470176 RepID=A0A221VX80_9PSEU|nr:molybdopterin-dependent oxidoreductase [Actinoalloteichus hoggarensis]ASO18115.1 Sulfoxide reductase catalytic subunit YedY precursor [Actinoalloteichus hoggarensis]MBB5921472.1 DMSO/TMAO reductase YedYZ molybdopterin-dependent catalytic subunit [Actinoalloteichus hoggarensis]